MPGGKNPESAVPDATPKLHDSSLQQGDVAMLQEGQQTMKQFQKPASGGSAPAPTARPAPNVQVPDAIDFIGGRAAGTVDGNAIGRTPPKMLDVERWRPLMQELARDPNTSGPLSTAMLSRLSEMNRQNSTVGVDIIVINAADDAVRESLR